MFYFKKETLKGLAQQYAAGERRKMENKKAQIKMWVKLTRGVKAKRRKTRAGYNSQN